MKAAYDFEPALQQYRDCESTTLKVTSIGARDLHALDGIDSRLQFQRPLLGTSEKAARIVHMVVTSSTPLRDESVSVTNRYARSSTRSGLVMILRTFKSDLLGYRYLIADEDLWEHISLFMCGNLRDETKRLGGHSQEWAL